MASPATSTTSLAVQGVVFAIYLCFFVLSTILYFGRKSYKCILLSCVKQLAAKQSSRKLAVEVSQRWWLDVLVTSIYAVVALRTFSELVRVVNYARQMVLGINGTPVLDQISLAFLLLSVTSYSLVFCALIWLWLRLSLTLFEESETKKNCIVWTVRITTLACVLSAAIVAVVLTVIFSIPNMNRTAVRVLFILSSVLYMGSLLALCLVVIILGIRIAVLIVKTSKSTSTAVTTSTVGSVSATTTTTEVTPAADHSDTGAITKPKHIVKFDEQTFQGQKTALIKVSAAVAAFVLSLAVRAVGITLLLLSNYIPNWVATLVLLAVPEFITFGTLIVVLWPFKVKCCHRYEAEHELASAWKMELKAHSTTASGATTPRGVAGSSDHTHSPVMAMAQPIEDEEHAVVEVAMAVSAIPQSEISIAASV